MEYKSASFREAGQRWDDEAIMEASAGPFSFGSQNGVT